MHRLQGLLDFFNSDQGEFGFFLEKASPISQLFSGTGKLEMRDQKGCMGKEKLGQCMVIF